MCTGPYTFFCASKFSLVNLPGFLLSMSFHPFPQTPSQGGDRSETVNLLSLLDTFALRAFNSDDGPIKTERYSESTQDFTCCYDCCYNIPVDMLS